MPDAVSIVSFSAENTHSDSMADLVRHMLCRNAASVASDDTSTGGDRRQRSDSHTTLRLLFRNIFTTQTR